VIMAATITSSSRAGVLLLGVELVAFFVLVLLTRRREAKGVAFIFVGLAALVIVAFMVAGTDRIKARFVEDKDPYVGRRQLFYSTLKLIEARPWTGYGMGTWRAVYPQTATFDLDLFANDAHNDWAQWTADGGIPFLLLMAALVIRIAKPAAQSIWGLGLLSVMVHSWVDYPLREPVLSFLWFALAGAVSQFDGGNSRRDDSGRAGG
jgi:O-antigen ligase